MANPVVLLIGGLDPQGCAGISADLLTAAQHDCHAVTLISARTEQSSAGMTQLGAVCVEKFMAEYRCIRTDFDIQAIKIGLIPNLEIATCIKQILTELPAVPVVLDPVLAATSGGIGVSAQVQAYIVEHLLADISILTPNLDELQRLFPASAMQDAVNGLLNNGLSAILVKGGHQQSELVTDFYQQEETAFYLYADRINTSNVRGTGCVLASSIACHLAHQQDMRDAVVLARAYINRGIRLANSAGPYRTVHHSQQPLVLEDLPKLSYQAESIGQQFAFAECPAALGIYSVVDSADWVKKLVDEGISTIQLRIKNTDEAILSEHIQKAVNTLTEQQIAFFVNDHWQLAVEHGAYGVHLGQEDLHDAQLEKIAAAGLRLGVSTHSYWELARALAVNPSYIALGPIFKTDSKQMPFSPQGEDRLKQWVTLLTPHYPLVAIGGIDLDRAQRLKQTGVGSVAMISAITKAADYRLATQALLRCWAA